MFSFNTANAPVSNLEPLNLFVVCACVCVCVCVHVRVRARYLWAWVSFPE